jgi:hypothetical protein
VLAESEMFWLSTVRGDGRPHVTPLPAIWLDGTLYFCTGPQEQKTRNLESSSRCVLAAGGNQFRSGLDVVVEGSWPRSGRPSSTGTGRRPPTGSSTRTVRAGWCWSSASCRTRSWPSARAPIPRPVTACPDRT